MTSLLAWMAADDKPGGKQIVSLNFASDSRISWGTGADFHWLDRCRKVFASDSWPEIVAFAGEVDLIQPIIVAFTSETNSRGATFQPDIRFGNLKNLLESGISIYSRTPVSSTVYYGARTGIGPRDSVFHFKKLEWNEYSKLLTPSNIPLNRESPSSTICWDGTGRSAVKAWQEKWNKGSPNLHFTRHIFSAFCDAIASGSDQRTGGAPQLATVRRKENGMLLGFVGGSNAYFKGDKIRAHSKDIPIEFFDANFQRVNQDGTLVKDAQKQPRPYEAPVPVRKITDVV